MRLGQLSRKLDLKPTEIRELIRNEFNVEIDLDLNTRIEDSYAAALSARYQPAAVEKQEQAVPVIAEKAEQADTKTADIEENGNEEEAPVHAPIEVPHYHASTNGTDTTENKDPFIPLPVDPDAELIKAPKIKLEGLKVIGKIDLPQPKETAPAQEDEVAASENGNHSTPKSFKERRLKNAPVLESDDEEYSIYKDKKGIYHFSQTQRENRKNSLERIKREKAEEARKQKKIKHYQQILEVEKKTESPAKKVKKQTQKESGRQVEKPQRKGIWGKFLNWLNG